MSSYLKNWRTILWLSCVALALLLMTNIIPVNKGAGIGVGNGLDYGLDFAGGTQLQLRLEHPVDADTMAVEKGILESRLNSLGLKDIPVRPWGNQYILISVAGASPQETYDIEEILKKQARFEERIDGEVAVIGNEISIDLSPQGMQIAPVGNGFTWSVSVTHTPEGACRFGKVGEGKIGRPVDIYIDRPDNTTILMTAQTYKVLSETTSSSLEDRMYFGDTAAHIIENRSGIPILTYSGDEATLAKLKEYHKSGYTRVIIAEDEEAINESVRNLLEENNFETQRIPQGNYTLTPHLWIQKITGLQSSPKLAFNTQGKCIYEARITGSSATLEEAKSEVKKNQVLLTSGNLPAKATIESKSTTPPTLGMKFLKYGFLTGVISFITVSLMIFIRYRKLSITLPMSATGLSEIIMILGLAALINWQIDLPAVAGIIASVGTGVDQLIVITDETLTSAPRKKKIVSLAESLKRAFFIIFTAAATVIAAMIPLLGIGAGMLKGFAFTTIMGVVVGVAIARPAYAKMIEAMLKREE
jgi:preprotein translocase subunit SecD